MFDPAVPCSAGGGGRPRGWRSRSSPPPELGGTWTLDRVCERLGIGAAIRTAATGRRLDGAPPERVVVTLVARRAVEAGQQACRDQQLLTHLESLIAGSDGWSDRCRDELVGSLTIKPGLRRCRRRTSSGLLRVVVAAVEHEAHLDGTWLPRTSDTTLTADDLAAAYEQLLQVERGQWDLTGALGLRPVFHFREDRMVASRRDGDAALVHRSLAGLADSLLPVRPGPPR